MKACCTWQDKPTEEEIHKKGRKAKVGNVGMGYALIFGSMSICKCHCVPVRE